MKVVVVFDYKNENLLLNKKPSDEKNNFSLN